MPARLPSEVALTGFEDSGRANVRCADLQRLDLTRLAWRESSRGLTDGGYERGRWYWWADVNRPRPEELGGTPFAEKIGQDRFGLTTWIPDPDCVQVPIPGVTGIETWFPVETHNAGGSVILRGYDWNPLATDKKPVMGLVKTFEVYFTPTEWTLYQRLTDDNWIRTADAHLLMLIYYSVLQWGCDGGNPVVIPSAISPQSVPAKWSGENNFVRMYEETVRQRIWNLRTDLRGPQRLPDGTTVDGLLAPSDKLLKRQPQCTSSAGKIVQQVVSTISALATLGQSSWLMMLYQIPQAVGAMQGMLLAGRLTSRISAQLNATPIQAPPELLTRASGGSQNAPGQSGTSNPPAGQTNAQGDAATKPGSGAAGLLIPLILAFLAS